MRNAATGIGLAVLGLGIAVNGLNLNGNQATATPAAFAPAAGPVEPTIVWYQAQDDGTNGCEDRYTLYRAWSDGTIERRKVIVADSRASGCSTSCDEPVREASSCAATRGWTVISSPNEGLNAQADINFDERVDAADLGQLLAAWGDAPRNDYPPSDCPLGLIP